MVIPLHRRRELADEYINRKVRFGHWKDNAIRLKEKP